MGICRSLAASMAVASFLGHAGTCGVAARASAIPPGTAAWASRAALAEVLPVTDNAQGLLNAQGLRTKNLAHTQGAVTIFRGLAGANPAFMPITSGESPIQGPRGLSKDMTKSFLQELSSAGDSNHGSGHVSCPKTSLGTFRYVLQHDLEFQQLRALEPGLRFGSLTKNPLNNRIGTERLFLRDELLQSISSSPSPSRDRMLRAMALTRDFSVRAEQLVAEQIFSYAGCSADWAALALFTRLNQQGLVYQLEKRVNQAAVEGSFADLRSRLNELVIQLSDRSLDVESAFYLDKQRQMLEQQLLDKLPQFNVPFVEVQEIASVLPPDGMLAEFQRYRPYDTRHSEKGSWGEARYLALLLRPDSAITTVDLGPAEKIDQAVAAMLTATKENIGDPPALLAKVRELVIDPLRPYMGDSRQWFLSPDAQLNRVPFAALPTGGGGTLAEERDLRLLTTGRELLALQKPSARRGAKPLVLADPDFGGEGDWQKLPDSSLEGISIAKLLGTEPLMGKHASARALLDAQGPWIIHVASHAYSLQDWEAYKRMSRSQIDKGVSVSNSLAKHMIDNLLTGARPPNDLTTYQKVIFDPLLNSGIVLSGANLDSVPDQLSEDRQQVRDDGYLTAKEASTLELEGTEMVTLSACETALGDIRSGEGVYGLQRALSVAGARSTLLSLWKVPDAATREFMERYYTLLLKEGKGRAEALRQVQQEFRNHPNSDYRAPYYWAAWQLVGDWRPLAK